MGANTNRALEEIAPQVPVDFILLAMPYTLLDQGCLHRGLARCLREGIGVVIGSPFASGILATGSGGGYDSAAAPEPVIRKVRAMEAVCARHGVSLPAAALQFPLAHPGVSAVVAGAKRPEQLAMNLRAPGKPVPPAFWADLRAGGLIDPEAPVPG